MTMVFIDSFDHYTDRLDKWDTIQQSQAPAISTTEGRFLNGSLKVGGGSKSGDLTKFIKVLNQYEYIAGFAVYFPTDCFFDVKFHDVTGAKCGEVTLNAPDVQLSDNAGTVVATAPSSITAATWQFVEFRCKSHATLGELEVRVDGTIVASATSLNTRGTPITQIRVEAHPTSADAFIDDLYVLNTAGAAPHNSFLGDTRVTVLRPKANGNTNNFTPTGAASNFQAVDDALNDGDATFVEAGQVFAKEDYDNFNFADLGISPGTIYGVQVVNAAKKTDAGQLRYVDQMVVNGARYTDGSEVTATTGLYKMTTFISDKDPSDNATWTESKVAAVGSGFEITFREI
jgi:hypothetical protein